MPLKTSFLRHATLLLGCVLLLCSCRPGDDNSIVVYTSQDQHFAEPLFSEFTRASGIKVRAVYDSEAVKTVGLANRLIAESQRPHADVWWSNEALRTWQLARRGVLDTNNVVEFGFRSRRLVVNTNHATVAAASLLELTNAQWRGKVALAYPMFGTTSGHFIALRQRWGAGPWEQWCQALAANKPFLVDGNSVVVKLVGRGDAVIGLTDFDDIVVAQRDGLPVQALPLNAESLLIPNTVAIVSGSKRSAEAASLIQFLSNPSTLQKMVKAGALEGANVPAAEVNWALLASDLEVANAELSRIFLR